MLIILISLCRLASFYAVDLLLIIKNEIITFHDCVTKTLITKLKIPFKIILPLTEITHLDADSFSN